MSFSSRQEHTRTRAPLRFHRVLMLIIILLVLSFSLFRLLQNRLIYYPDHDLILTPDHLGLTYEEIYFSASDGVALHGWYIPAKDPPTDNQVFVLFLHGNAGNISHFLAKVSGLSAHGLNVFCFDYRGFGKSAGSPNEQGTYLDAEAAWQTLLDRTEASPEQVVIYGYSLGGAVAVNLALSRPANPLILESTFTSIRDMARDKAPFLPGFLVKPVYESLNKISQIDNPTLFIHGRNDRVVPASMSLDLFKAHPGPKEIFLVPEADHTDVDLIGGKEFYDRILAFINKYHGRARPDANPL